LEFNEALRQLFIDFKKAYNSDRRDVLYNIFIECSVPMKMVRLMKMCFYVSPLRERAESYKVFGGMIVV